MKYCNVHRTDTLTPLPESIMVCATVDDAGAEHEITELMIRRACEQMDADQLWPFADSTLCDKRPLPVGGADILPFRKSVNHVIF